MSVPSIWNCLSTIPFKQYYLDANGIRTRVLESGEGEPLILLHGTGGHLEAYAKNIKGLSERFRVICIDMVGHGYSGKPNCPYTVDVYSDHLLHVLRSLHLQKVHLSGESLGGWVAAWFAAHHPEHVNCLILNTPGNINNKPEVMQRLKESTIKAVVDANYESVRKRLEWLMYDKSQVTDELVEVRYRIYGQPEFKEAVYNIVALQEPEIRQKYAWDRSWCGKIQAPTLLVWTDHDPTSSVDEAKLLLDIIPGSKLLVIEGAGHWPQWEKPEEFNRIHHQFILERSI